MPTPPSKGIQIIPCDTLRADMVMVIALLNMICAKLKVSEQEIEEVFRLTIDSLNTTGPRGWLDVLEGRDQP